MPPLKFYFVPYTTAGITKAVLEELEFGLPNPLAERIELSIKAGDTKAPHYLSTVNPNGCVPAIVHDGIPIWESAAITMYLGETFGVDAENPKKSLYPALGPKRGEAMKWIVWTNVVMAAAASGLMALTAQCADKKPSEDKTAELEKARKKIVDGLGILNGGLEGRAYLLGESYYLADTHVWSVVSWITMLDVKLDAHPNVKAWAANVGARPALQNLHG